MGTVRKGIVRAGIVQIGIVQPGLVNAAGESGPRVTIRRNSDPGFCEYEPPGTVFCAASETYTALDYGFSGSTLSYVWSVTGGNAIISGSSLAQTVTIDTQNSANNQTFELTCTVSNADPEEIVKVQTFTQNHTDINVTPEYIGPNINDRDYVIGVPITPVDTLNLFTGTNLVFTLEGTWPTGLVIDSATGQITGTPTGAEQPYPDLTVKVTNSKGDASSSAFSITLTSSAVAPLFDNGPVPEQVWQIDEPIAQFPIGQFFLTGSFPRTYTIESGALPTGLTMNTAGQINGTPTVESETGSVVIRCTNSAGFALTNDWTWLTWEAIAAVGTIADQTANVGTLFTHDYSQYFSGTVSGYVISAASWPPDTVFDTQTGIASFMPTVEFTHTGAVVVAESDYTPAFVSSNNFAWTVTDVLVIDYLLYASFDAADQSFTDAQVLGPSEGVDVGSLTVVNKNGSAIEIANSRLSLTTAISSWGVCGIYGEGLQRSRGLSVLTTFQLTASPSNTVACGFSNTAAIGHTTWLDIWFNHFSSTSLNARSYDGSGGSQMFFPMISPTVIDTDYKLSIIVGGYENNVPWDGVGVGFAEGGAWYSNDGENWLLEYRAGFDSTNTIYPIVEQNSASTTTLTNNLRIPDADLSNLLQPTNLNTSVVTDDTFTHIADCVIESAVTTLPTAGNYDIEFRRQDDSNKWVARITSAGALSLVEVAATVETARASAGTVANGQRAVVIADDESITLYSNDTTSDTYALATNFKTDTGGKVAFGSGVISYVADYPRGTNGEYSQLDDYDTPPE